MNKSGTANQVHPLVTIIVAVFNEVKFLQQCIDSVANQTYSNIELIIIDGGSTDGSVELLRMNRSNITYSVSEPDNGIYSAWNKGLVQAKGDWICFLGADDFFWDDQVLERISPTLSSLSENIRVFYGQVMLLTKSGQPLYKIGKPWCQVKHKFTKFMSIPHPGVMHRSSLFSKNGDFDASFRIVGDYELLLRELKVGDAEFIPIVVAGVRQGGVSCNSGHSLTLLKEVRRAQTKNGFYMPSAVFLLSVVNLSIRKIVWYSLGEKKARKLLDFGRRIIGLPEYWTKN